MNTFDKITAVVLGAFVGYAAYGFVKGYVIGRGADGIGKVERVKRRIYKEVAVAQKAGIDFERKITEYNENGLALIESIGKQFGWKQSSRSIESGKSYAEAYFNSLRRAYNAVSGVQGVGEVYEVRNGEGKVVLTWSDAMDHVKQEPSVIEDLERRNAETRRRIRNRQRSMKLPVVYNTQEEEPANENEAETPMTKQQEILAKFPYLKTHDYGKTLTEEEWEQWDGELPVTDAFNFVVWKKTVGRTNGETLLEGPVAAFVFESEAKEFRNKISKALASQNEAYRNIPVFKEKTTFTVKPVEKVKLDAISGLYDFSI